MFESEAAILSELIRERNLISPAAIDGDSGGARADRQTAVAGHSSISDWWAKSNCCGPSPSI